MSTKKTIDYIDALIAGDTKLAEAFQKGFYAQGAAHLITQMRLAAGLSQAQLAAKLGVKAPRISEAENPKGSDGPTYRVMCQVAEACGFRWPTSIADLAPIGQVTTPQAQGQLFVIEADPAPQGRKTAGEITASEASTVGVFETLIDAMAEPAAGAKSSAEGRGLTKSEEAVLSIFKNRAAGRLRILGQVTLGPSGQSMKPNLLEELKRLFAIPRKTSGEVAFSREGLSQRAGSGPLRDRSKTR
jgi:transcriptional regulator with XRE-family HTH domain